MTVYTVESGDSVYSIARKFGVPASRIVTDNELSNPSRLIVGQSIVILYPTETYTVRGGDTLDAVSRRTGVSLNELWRNNPTLGGKSTVYPGQTLNIRYEVSPLGNVYTNGYVYTYVNRDVLRKTLPYLTYLSVFSHGFKEDGSLLPPEGGDEEIISIAKEYGTIPLLTLTSITENGTFSSELVESLLSSPVLTSSVAASLAETAVENGYGGVDLDFEYIPSQYADGYVASESFAGRICDLYLACTENLRGAERVALRRSRLRENRCCVRLCPAHDIRMGIHLRSAARRRS